MTPVVGTLVILLLFGAYHGVPASHLRTGNIRQLQHQKADQDLPDLSWHDKLASTATRGRGAKLDSVSQ